MLSASWAGGGPCAVVNDTGCDIWLAELDADGALMQVVRLTDQEGAGEGYPMAPPELSWLVFASHDEALGYVARLDLETGSIETIDRPAHGPDYDPVHRRLAWQHDYGGGARDVVVAELAEDGSIGTPTRLTTQGDGAQPILLPDGERVAVYRSADEAHEGHTEIVSLAGGEPFVFSEEDGCAHGTHTASGDAVLCQAQVQMHQRTWDGAAWSELSLYDYPSCTDPEDPLLTELCALYEGCDRVSWGYPERCGPLDLVYATMQCIIDDTITWSRVVGVDLDGHLLVDLHGQVEALLGVEGSSRDASCLALELNASPP